MTPGRLALLAVLLSIGTAVAFIGLLYGFFFPIHPAWYLSGLALGTLLAVVAVWRARRVVTFAALVVTVLLLLAGSHLNFVVARVPPTRPAFVVGQAAPDFTLPDAAGRPVTLSEYRGRKPLVLVFYRGYW